MNFIVQESLLGRGDKLKSYTIGVDVFGRDEGFDATNDPAVRVEASRLRKSLHDYYSTEKNLPNPRITLPKGKYIPSYIYSAEGDEKEVSKDAVVDSKNAEISAGEIVADRRSDAPPEKPARTSIDDNPNADAGEVSRPQSQVLRRAAVAGGIAILAISMFALALGWLRQMPPLPADPGQPVVIIDHVARQNDDPENRVQIIDASLVRAFSRFDDKRAIQPLEPLSANTSFLPQFLAEQKASVYILESNARISTDLIDVNWQLINARTLDILWSDTTTEQRTSADKAEVEIAARIAAFTSERLLPLGSRELRSEPGEVEPGFVCVTMARAYRTTLLRAEHAIARDCLEKTVKIYPNYADAWLWLALLYADEYRFNYNLRSSPEDALSRLQQAAKHGLEVAPFSAMAHAMAALSAHLSADDDMAKQEADRALSINSDESRVIVVLGSVFVSQGKYDDALNLAKRADYIKKNSPNLLAHNFYTEAVAAYANKDYDLSIDNFNKYKNKPYLVEVFLAASYERMGNITSARLHIESLLKLEPNFATDGRKLLARLRFTKALNDDLIDGLRAAGLDLKP